MKNVQKYVLMISVLVVMFTASTMLHYMMSGAGSEASRRDGILLASRVHDAIESELQGPMQVSKSMSKNTFLLEQLKEEKTIEEGEFTARIQKYLSEVKKGGAYETVYLVSEATRRCYTFDGLYKTIDETADSSDSWYSTFVNSGHVYSLNVANDIMNGEQWTIFIHSRIEDEEGKLLGVCGIGVKMSEIQDLLGQFEKDYGVEINTVNADGLVQADTDSINIETTYLIEQMLSDMSNYVYTNKGDGYVVTKYIEDIDWFLIVQDEIESGEEEFDATFLLRNLFLFVCILIAGILIMRNIDKRALSRQKESNQTDALTGVPNRNYFKEVYGERGVFNTARYKSLAVFDIDFFKEANDLIDGDDVLRSIVRCAQEIIGEEGQIFRWGGDEFTVLMRWSPDESYELCREFCKAVEKEGRVTVSVGVTEVRLSDSIKTNYYRAAQACYLVKEMGGNGVKRN